MSQLDIILWLQSFRSPLLDTFFLAVTNTAQDSLVTLIAVLLYWCVEPLIGLRFLLVVLTSSYLNDGLKDFFHTLRPTSDQVWVATPPDGTYAFPSGHTQNAAVLWSYLAGHYRRWYLITAAIILIPLVALSRLYLGAHWPIDVVGGMMLGIAMAWLALRFYRAWDRRSPSFPLWVQLALGMVVPLFLFIIYPKTSQATGAALGVITGYILERRYVRFPIHLPLARQAVKVVIGLSVVILLQVFLPQLLPVGPAFRFSRYALIGLWGTLGAPWVFKVVFSHDA